MENSLLNKGGPPASERKEDTPAVTPEGPAQEPQAAAPASKYRTPGLKIFDVLLYPLLTNVGVFAISVGATYLTSRGGDRDASGKRIYGKLGEFFQKRGEWLIDKFKSTGMTHEQADMSKMVFFSFLDGSLLAPVVKMFEDRRENIACAIDQQLGTKPEDMSVYAAEPKQSWSSVLGGRAMTAAIVVPTAVTLDKTGLNNTLFNQPGMRLGKWLATKPNVQKMFGKLDVKELSRISFFEAFYTSVCTAGLYFTSRGIARRQDPPKQDPVPTVAVSPCIAELTPPPVEAEDAMPKNKHAVTQRASSFCEQYAAEPSHASPSVSP